MVAQSQFEVDGNWSSVEYGNNFLSQIADETSGELSVVGHSVLGDEILAVTIGNGVRKCLVTSGVHGTEPASREGVLIKARDICYNTNGNYTDYLNDHTMMIIPTMNPDRMHRSYRNEDGVDINRVIYKLDSPEGLTYLNVLRDFNPEVHFDYHEHSGGTDKNVLYVYPMSLDPNSDLSVREIIGGAISTVSSSIEEDGFLTGQYFRGNTGFGSLTSGAGILGKVSITAETRVGDEPAERIELQMKNFDYFIDWHGDNHLALDKMKNDFTENMLKENDRFSLLQGMEPGAEMYLQATHQNINLPTSYQLEDVSGFQPFIDAYNIQVMDNGVISVNQGAGRMIPHLLDPESDLKVANALRIEPDNLKRTDGRYTFAKYEGWREVFIKGFT